MKILFWMSTSFQTTSRHLLVSILDELIKSGHQVTIIKKKVGTEQEELPEELHEKNIKCISIAIKPPRKSNLVARYLKDIGYILKCRRYLTECYDAVFVQSSNVAGFSLYYLQKKQSKAIKTINVQDTFPENAVMGNVLDKNSLIYRVTRTIQRYAYKHANHIITISEDMKELLVKSGKADPNKVDVIYNWSYQDDVYSINQIEKSELACYFKPGFFNVVYAGNIGVMQNVDILIHAAQKLKGENIWFLIFGNGVYQQKLKKMADENNVRNIAFYPMQPAELAPLIYSLADVNVIPLKKDVYKTALPSKTATCMACQRPIIFAIGKGSKFGQKVQLETGCCLIESDDVEGLAEAIKAIRDKRISMNTASFFQEYMSKSKNSREYARIITSN